MRHEIKYRIHFNDPAVVEQVVRNHPAGLVRLYPDRQVNNIYFDTLGLQCYKDNVVGIAERQKFRVRWYGNDVTEIQNPRFEIKARINELGTKKVENIDRFDLSDLEVLTQTVNRLSRTNVPLYPVLLNSYSRSYFGTFDGKYRITIDNDLRFHSLLNEGQFRQYIHQDPNVILEFKYDREYALDASRISQPIPFRRTKNSKYVTGVRLSNAWLSE